MMTEWRILLAILLGLLLAGRISQVAYAPRGEINSPPPSPAPKPVIARAITPPLHPENGPMDEGYPTVNLVETARGIVPGPTSTATSAIPYSCTDAQIGSGTFVWPADNHFLSGKDYRPDHLGIDIAAGKGSPVYAADTGFVIAKGNDEAGYGNVIMIDHGNGYWTIYAHLSEIGVSMCQSVKNGQWIGAAGDTGNARGVHLHFEVMNDGQSLNPWLVLP